MSLITMAQQRLDKPNRRGQHIEKQRTAGASASDSKAISGIFYTWGRMVIRLSDATIPQHIRHGTAFFIKKFGPLGIPTLLLLTARAEIKSNLALVVAGGHKRGNVLLVLPPEAYSSSLSVSRGWLALNWNRWVDPDSDVDGVYILPDLMDLVEPR